MDFALLAALRDAVKECVDLSCEYKFLVSLGEPPADCNTIAFWLSASRRNRSDNTECTTAILDSDVTITLTRCCVTADASPDFDYIQEEKDAECFHQDLEALLTCLSCEGSTMLEEHISSCGTLITSVRLDREKLGGCYSASIDLSVTHDICCPE